MEEVIFLGVIIETESDKGFKKDFKELLSLPDLTKNKPHAIGVLKLIRSWLQQLNFDVGMTPWLAVDPTQPNRHRLFLEPSQPGDLKFRNVIDRFRRFSTNSGDHEQKVIAIVRVCWIDTTNPVTRRRKRDTIEKHIVMLDL